jgi:hypothetical protein
MVPHCARANTTTWIDNNLQITIRPVKNVKKLDTFTFQQDGTIVPNNALTILAKYGGIPISIVMHCEKCEHVPLHVPLSAGGRKVDTTNINSVKHQFHSYAFYIGHGTTDGFTCNLQQETIRYHINNKFYHLIADLVEGSAQFRMGTCAGGDTLQQLLDTLMHLDVPKFDPTTIKSLDGFVNKVKVFNLFS